MSAVSEKAGQSNQKGKYGFFTSVAQLVVTAKGQISSKVPHYSTATLRTFGPPFTPSHHPNPTNFIRGSTLDFSGCNFSDWDCDRNDK